MISCKKDQSTKKLTFSSCNFAENQNLPVKDNKGTLTYTNQYASIVSEYRYVIKTPNQYDLFVCNMPPSIKLRKGEVKKVIFSGNVLKVAANAFATAIQIELTKLNFQLP